MWVGSGPKSGRYSRGESLASAACRSPLMTSPSATCRPREAQLTSAGRTAGDVISAERPVTSSRQTGRWCQLDRSAGDVSSAAPVGGGEALGSGVTSQNGGDPRCYQMHSRPGFSSLYTDFIKRANYFVCIHDPQAAWRLPTALPNSAIHAPNLATNIGMIEPYKVHAICTKTSTLAPI